MTETTTLLIAALVAALVQALKKLPLGPRLSALRTSLLPLVIPAALGALLGVGAGLVGLLPAGDVGAWIVLGVAAGTGMSALVHQGERLKGKPALSVKE